MNSTNNGSDCQLSKRNGRIYFIRCLITGMYYVGQTIQKLELRIAQHKRRKTSEIGKAINELGWENFIYAVLEDNVPFELLNEREKFWIEYYDCVYPKGYNKTHGGQSVGCLHSEDTRKKISDSKTGEKNPMFGKIPWNKGIPRDDATRRKISEKLKGKNNPNYGKKRPEHSIAMTGENNPMFGKPSAFKGKHHTKATKAIISSHHSGKGNPFYGKHHTEETRAKMSKSHKKNSESEV